jgi:hypothetical protein
LANALSCIPIHGHSKIPNLLLLFRILNKYVVDFNFIILTSVGLENEDRQHKKKVVICILSCHFLLKPTNTAIVALCDLLYLRMLYPYYEIKKKKKGELAWRKEKKGGLCVIPRENFLGSSKRTSKFTLLWASFVFVSQNQYWGKG